MEVLASHLTVRFPKVPALVVAIILGGGLLLSLAPGAQCACGPPWPTAGIRLDQANATALPHHRDAAVNFSGQAYIDKMPVERCVLRLMASLDTGWSIGLQPEVFVFTSTRPQPFCVTVTVPAGTPGGTVGNLVVEARGDVGGLRLHTATRARVDVAPCTGIGLETATPVVRVPIGGTATVELSVRNDGNMNDSYSLAVAGREALRDRGWALGPQAPELSGLRPGESRQVRLRISARPGLSMPDRPEGLNITVSSLNSSRREGIGNRSFVVVVFPGRPDAMAALRGAGWDAPLRLPAPAEGWAPWGIASAAWLAALAAWLGRRRAFR